MRNVGPKQILAVILAMVMVRPYPVAAAPAAAVIGSISSYGAVSVGELASPSENTLFAGDLVNTQLGSAVVQYKEGTRVLLAMNSSAQFTVEDVQLQSGQMTFQTASDPGPVFHASSLRLEPAPSSSANVILNDQKASVNVTEGTVRVVDPTGVPLASIQAGEAKLFAMASAAAVPPAAAAPQMGGGSGTVWLLALGIAAVATSLGIAALIRANNADDSAEAAAQQISALQGTINTLQGQITTLQEQIATLQSSGTAQAAQIAALQSTVSTLQNTINSLQSTVSSLQSTNSAQAAQINSLLSQIAGLQSQVNNLLAQIAELEQRLEEISPNSP